MYHLFIDVTEYYSSCVGKRTHQPIMVSLSWHLVRGCSRASTPRLGLSSSAERILPYALSQVNRGGREYNLRQLV